MTDLWAHDIVATLLVGMYFDPIKNEQLQTCTKSEKIFKATMDSFQHLSKYKSFE